MKIRLFSFVVGDEKKGEGKKRESTQSHKWVVFHLFDTFRKISTKTGTAVEVDVIII